MDRELEKNQTIEFCYSLMELDFADPVNQEFLEKSIKELKAENYFPVNSFCEYTIEGLQKEKSEIEKKIRTIGKIQEILNDNALAILKRAGINKIETALGHVMKIKSTKTVSVFNEKLLPSWAVVTKNITTTSADKRLIKDALDKGQEVAGAKLVVNEWVDFK